MTFIIAEVVRESLDYNPDTGIFLWKIRPANTIQIGDVAGGVNNEGYIQIRLLGRMLKAHRLAWLYVYGVWPKEQLDHINGIKSDNRISNLREASNGQNRANSKASCIAGHKGIRVRSSGKWEARIRYRTKEIYLGTFSSRQLAEIAYRQAASKYHQEFARPA